MNEKLSQNPLFKLATELGPLVIFFIANGRFGIFAATGAFMAATVIALATSYILTRHLPIIAVISAGIVMVFGMLTLILHDETFIKMKPTIIYSLFAGALFVGLAIGKPLIAAMFGPVMKLTEEGWRKLSLNWALFFAAMAVLNEIVWRTQTTEFWVSFKAFGTLPLTVGFAILQVLLMRKYELQNETEAGKDDSLFQ